MNQEKGTTVNSWYRWFLGQDFIKTLNKYGRLPLEMNVDKLMTKMKESDMLQVQLKHSLEERDLKLLDALTDAIKDKSS